MNKSKRGNPRSLLGGFLSNRLSYLVLFAIVAIGILIYMMSGQVVYIVNCDDQYHLYTGLRAEGEEVLEHLGISLDRHDQITQKDGDILSRIDVTRAYTVTLYVDGGQRTVYTVGESVNTILQREGVVLETYDAVSPEGEDIPRAGSSIVVSRGTVEYVEESVRIPYDDVKVESNDYYVGTTIKTTDGKEGEAINKYALIYRDGELVSRELVSKTVVSEAEDAYYIVGTQSGAESSVKAKLTIKSTEVETTTKKPSSSSSSGSSGSSGNKKPSSSSSSSSSSGSSSSSSGSSSSSSSNLGGATGFGGQKGTITVTENADGTGTVTTVGGKTYKYKKSWLMTATAFSHQQTALGVKPGWGTVAVDKSVIKLRSKVYVCNKYFTWQYQEGLSTAQDVGVKGESIDLWMYNRTMSYKFGRRPCWVYLISEP